MKGTVYKAVLVVLLSTVSGNAAPAWVKISIVGPTTGYVDPETIVREGDTVKMMALMDYATPPDKNEIYLSTRRLSEYDCKERKQRAVTVAAYSGHMGTGDLVNSASDPSRDWRPLVPGSVAETMWKVACSKRGRVT
jgi:hypothetical protein